MRKLSPELLEAQSQGPETGFLRSTKLFGPIVSMADVDMLLAAERSALTSACSAHDISIQMLPHEAEGAEATVTLSFCSNITNAR